MVKFKQMKKLSKLLKSIILKFQPEKKLEVILLHYFLMNIFYM